MRPKLHNFEHMPVCGGGGLGPVWWGGGLTPGMRGGSLCGEVTNDIMSKGHIVAL